MKNKDIEGIEELLEVYKPTQYEKLLIATVKNDVVLGEKLFYNLKLNTLSAKENIIANYCNFINKRSDDELAGFIICVAAPFALKNNDGVLYKMLLEKLTNLAYIVGKYKAVANMNLIYFKMLDKCKLCLH